jgi:hypothetical protein
MIDRESLIKDIQNAGSVTKVAKSYIFEEKEGDF